MDLMLPGGSGREKKMRLRERKGGRSDQQKEGERRGKEGPEMGYFSPAKPPFLTRPYLLRPSSVLGDLGVHRKVLTSPTTLQCQISHFLIHFSSSRQQTPVGFPAVLSFSGDFGNHFLQVRYETSSTVHNIQFGMLGLCFCSSFRVGYFEPQNSGFLR